MNPLAETIFLKGGSPKEECHVLQFDGAAEPNPGPAGGAAVCFRPDGSVLFEATIPLGHATNNRAEIHGLLLGIQKAVEFGVRNLFIEGDSQLILFQLQGRWKIKDEYLKKIHEKIHELLQEFESVACRHIYREFNTYADRLSKEVLLKGE